MYQQILWKIVLITSISLNAQPIQFDTVCFTGNLRTKSAYLHKFLGSGKGSAYNHQVINEDLRKLRTISSIYHANCEIKQQDSLLSLVFEVEERWTLLPVGDFGFSNNNLWVGAGFMESNLFGRGIYSYAYIQYKAPFAAHLIFRNPYILGSKFGYEFEIKAKEYQESKKLNYADNYLQGILKAGLRYQLMYEKNLMLGYAFQKDKVFIQESLIDERNVNKLFLELDLQKMDFKHFMTNGWHFKFKLETVLPLTDHKKTQNVYSELGLYKTYGIINLASRSTIGVSTESNPYFYPFVIDSYKNFRGSGYRYATGNTLFVENFEARVTIFQNRLLGVQALVFTDLGCIATKDHSKFNRQNLNFVGMGTRFNFKKAHNAVLSIDYGANLNQTTTKGWVIGWGQYF